MLANAVRLATRSFFHLYDGPVADIVKTAAGYEIQLELPGVKKDAIKVNVEKDVLRVTAEKNPVELGGAKLVHSERKFGTIRAQFRLPPTAQVDKLEAVLSDGVLVVSVPDSVKDAPKVDIKVQ
jgi:HSP20 family protein